MKESALSLSLCAEEFAARNMLRYMGKMDKMDETRGAHSDSKQAARCVKRETKMEMPTMARQLFQSFLTILSMFLFVGLGVFSSASSAADVVLQLSDPAPEAEDRFGIAVSAVPDINGDGKWDAVVSAQPFTLYPPEKIGWIRLFDGANGNGLGRLGPVAPSEWSRFGDNVLGVPDLDGDGFGDVVASDDADGVTYAFNGKTRTIIRSSPVWGSKICGFPDLDGDGVWEIVLGRYWYTPTGASSYAGEVCVYSGKTGDRILTIVSPNMQEQGVFGCSLAVVPDTNGNGTPDLLVGSGEMPNGQPEKAGRAYLFDGGTTQVLRTFVSPNPAEFGDFSYAPAGIPDLTGDGKGEVVISAHGESPDGSPQYSGRAYLFDGVTGALLRTFRSPHEVQSGAFGYPIAAIPDINGDGKWEIAIGATGEWVDSYDAAGRVYVFDGATGVLLRSLISPNAQSNGYFGCALAGMPDVDGKNGGELIVGADGEFQDSGRAYIFFLSPHDRPASVGMNWTLYGSAGALGFRTGEPGVKTVPLSR